MNQNKKPQKDSVKIGKTSLSAFSSTQAHLPISEIHDDVLVLKNGGIRAVLNATSINFNLKSEDEQKSILYSYQGFLNTIDFPIQIVVRSKKLDIDLYLENLKKIGEKQENQLLQHQTFEYIDYVQKLVEYADIMEKDFYVIIPFDPFRSKKMNPIEKLLQTIKGKDTFSDIQRRKNEFAELKKGLSTRVNVARGGLENCGLKIDQLNTKQLIELFYNTYNPTTSRQEKLDNIEKTTVETELIQEKT